MRKNDLGLSYKEYQQLLQVRRHMIGRCYDPEYDSYRYYGARGIYVCEEWLKSPYSFVAFAVKNGWKHGLTLDRIDNNGQYSPDNCRFVTVKEQARNRKSNILITVGGETKCLLDWCIELGINYDAARGRYDRSKTKDPKRILFEGSFVHNHDSRPVVQIEKASKKIIAKYQGAKEANEATGIHRDSIYNACKGKLRTAGGYVWRYADEATV